MPGISVFDLQARIGHSSPEIHRFFPRDLTVRQTIENAWAETFRGRAVLNHDRDLAVDACLRWFHGELSPALVHSDPPDDPTATVSYDGDLDELDWADEVRFGELAFTAQRLVLLLRAIVKQPDLIILDEAFSGMDNRLREKCMLFIEYGESRFYRFGDRSNMAKAFYRHHIREEGYRKKQELVATERALAGTVRFNGMHPRQALICVSHVREEVPEFVREWLCLPEPHLGQPARFGRLQRPLALDDEQWREIWALNDMADRRDRP